jgi:hypothetical protein
LFARTELTMDTIFVDQALKAYRDKTGDERPWEALQVTVTSQILKEAQQLKDAGRERYGHPVAADGPNS